MSPSNNPDLNLLGSVFSHLVLPPKIPGAQDIDITAVSQDILMRMIAAIDTAISLTCDVPWREAYHTLQDSLRACFELNRGHLERNSLLKHFRRLHPGQMLILYLNEQNAGLLVRCDTKEDGKCVTFESFEASASSFKVLAAGHAMEWDFPGRSAHIDFNAWTEKLFQQSLAEFLEQASIETLYTLQASTRKAGVYVSEIRDTTDPALITQMLMSLLEAIGGQYQAPVLRKKIRDDVNLTKANIPWRRLPFWLILRVAAQRQLCFALGAEQGQVAYKVLIAILLAELLDNSSQCLSPHEIVCLRTKLARRMVKLEINQEKIKLHKDATYNSWLTAASGVVRVSIENANAKMEADWDSFKRNTTRRVWYLPRRAPPDSLKLSLPNSGSYLDEILSTRLYLPPSLVPDTLPNPLTQSIQQGQQFTDRAFKLAALEQRIEQDASQPPNPNPNHEYRCLELESQIENVFDTVGSTYNSNPEQNSAMILSVFTLWVELDRSSTASCQLLADHAPVFHPELLDALQLPTKLEMERVQKIQEHLANRHARSIYGSILETHTQHSIALRYIATSRHLQSLERRIQVAYEYACQMKAYEHTNICNEYDEHTEGIAENLCLCTFEDGERIVKGCASCWHRRVRNRLEIMVQESFLPEENYARGTIVFELGMPNWFSAYRDATWYILSKLTHPYQPKGAQNPEIHLQKFTPLVGFMEANVNRLSLASKIKCFEQTHYNFSRGKVPLTRVLLPFAADFKLYDSKSNLWVEELTKPLTLEHICGIQIPHSLLPILPNKLHPPTIVDGPSSYEIQANQAVVPKDVSVQAFSAYQKLLAGKRRRWPNILVELSSSNLNLSDENTMRVICQLASQAGPRLPDESLRAVHEIFQYPVFTTRLMKILGTLLESIGANWREHNIMQLVITLALRLFHLSGKSLGTSILATARKCLLKWICELRKKIQVTSDSAEAQRYTTYGLYAALLCRETLAIFIGSGNKLSRDDLLAWMQASIAMQENILHDIRELSDTLRSLLLRDAKMGYHLRDHITNAMKTYQSTVGVEILSGWPTHFLDDEKPRVSCTFLSEPHHHWIVVTTPGRFPDKYHFNYIEGHLLVNGEPRSKLPIEIADDEDVKAIFGDQHLLTFPSRQLGMSHRLARLQEEKYEVHFGLRNGRAVIRATAYNYKSRARETCEFVPRWRLRSSSGFDLPAELIDNCGHWLNVNSRCLEIRRGLPKTPTFWKTLRNDWILDVPGRRASRGNGGSQLVDPQSETFTRVADIFRDFEQADKLTVFQPQNSTAGLTVELKHLDLHFEVNQNRLLWCQQLNAEIDTNQDAGTWYGLCSKIVMREIKTQSCSIIVPLGRPVVRRNGSHVDVRIQGASHYARFMIDSIIGRLSCSPEPRLIYTKALYHAVTSFCLPDTLTGRTGSAEAFAVLRSGAAQPWTPVNKAVNEIFDAFDKLVPRREYYPPNIKRIQKVTWNQDLTSSIQCDGYRSAIEVIKEKSNNLEVFTTQSGFELIETGHLCIRGVAQRQIYDPLLDVETSQEFNEAVYTPRDRKSGTEAAQVYHISRVVLSRCSQFHMSRTLRSILESCEIIGGFSALDTVAPISYAAPLISQIEDPITENWGELVDFCRHRANKASLLFRLGLLAFHSEANMDIIHSLASLCLVDEIKNLNPPRHKSFVNFQSREPPSIEHLEALMRSTYPKFQPVRNRRGEELLVDANNRDATEHSQVCIQEGTKLARRIQQYWPTPATDMTMEMLSQASEEFREHHPQSLVDIGSAWDKVNPEWQRRYANLELDDYVMRVDEVLASLCCVRDTAAPAFWTATEPDFVVTQHSLSYWSIIQDWTAKEGPTPKAAKSSLLSVVEKYRQSTTQPRPVHNPLTYLAELGKIIQEFEQSDNNLRKQYAEDLRKSLTALEVTDRQLQPNIIAFASDSGVNSVEIENARSHASNIWTAIASAFTANDNREPWLGLGAMKPLSTATELLKLLRSTEYFNFGPNMKEAIVSYGLAVTDVQHLVRIQHAFLCQNHQALHDELHYVGHETWDPIEEPDWLLLEIDSNILIRTEQVAVARAMINPTLGNGVLQLSMGKGKTSCIIPMVEAVLADGENLSRVVVPKALLTQTAQTIQSRLGGLVGREVIHIPYSRRTSTEEDTLDLYANLHYETQQCHGVILTCSEHLLSYKLFGWQKFVDSKRSTADQMIKFQKWLDKHCRDVLDECDVTLSVKTQLNYPSGPEMPIDFHPYRWQIAQELLGLVHSRLRELQRKHPRGIQVTSRRKKECFPAVQFLRADAENALHDLIIDDIFSGRLTFLRPAHPQYQQKRSAIREVLCGTRISDKLLNRVAKLFDNPNIAENTLLLIRGLLLHKIIIMCLGKRWNVQYGLHPDRDPIAVPYEAKGKPSEQAEYGHPDATILFTCLSFYYAGLSRDQLVQGVQYILQSNDPAAQYEWWTSTCTELPGSLRCWNVLNADDKGQMEQLWGFLRWNRIVINHYLNHFVFPVHARQFQVKLQACSWDIPISLEKSTQATRTTGFSGTNDNRLMLPLTISQRDLPELQHTSAEVLSYLLQKRNRGFHTIADKDGKRLTERDFLSHLKAKGISVLIDAGAYISEMGNKDLAQTWLEVDSEAKAVVYFHNDNRAWVHYRNNAKEDVPLLATPLAEKLSECNVFLDQGHTRGVDLRLPTNARGAVTLALKLTKDHAVQAAMRLRQLQTTQSVCFYGPPEVESSIIDFHRPNSLERIDSSHVVSWLLEQTCRSIEDLQGLYVAQGIDFCQRTDAVWHCKNFMMNISERQKLLYVLKQPERKTLKQLYGAISEKPLTNFEGGLTSLQLRSFVSKLVQTSRDQQGSIQAGALEEVEQEREVEAQREQVRQVEKRKKYDVFKFPGMHPEILRFAQTGTLETVQLTKNKTSGFEHAFAFVGKTTIAKPFGVHETSSRLFVSKEFTKTVKAARNSQESDNFLRPVEWIIWSPETETALVIIPEEAEYILEVLRGRRGKSHTYLIAYAAPVTKAMIHFNNLDFYSIPEIPKEQAFPERIKIELGILAGRLYVDHSEWKAMAKYVRGPANELNSIAADPAAFLLNWLTIRRKTVNILHTPMGYICTGREMEIAGLSESADGEDGPRGDEKMIAV